MTKERADELVAKYSDVLKTDDAVELHVVYHAIEHDYESYAIVLTTLGVQGRLPIALYTDGDYFESVRQYTIKKREQAQQAL